eukprot:358961-Chlamydomonas_euryale.AAC.4
MMDMMCSGAAPPPPAPAPLPEPRDVPSTSPPPPKELPPGLASPPAVRGDVSSGVARPDECTEALGAAADTPPPCVPHGGTSGPLNAAAAVVAVAASATWPLEASMPPISGAANANGSNPPPDMPTPRSNAVAVAGAALSCGTDAGSGVAGPKCCTCGMAATPSSASLKLPGSWLAGAGASGGVDAELEALGAAGACSADLAVPVAAGGKPAVVPVATRLSPGAPRAQPLRLAWRRQPASQRAETRPPSPPLPSLVPASAAAFAAAPAAAAASAPAAAPAVAEPALSASARQLPTRPWPLPRRPTPRPWSAWPQRRSQGSAAAAAAAAAIVPPGCPAAAAAAASVPLWPYRWMAPSGCPAAAAPQQALPCHGLQAASALAAALAAALALAAAAPAAAAAAPVAAVAAPG